MSFARTLVIAALAAAPAFASAAGTPPKPAAAPVQAMPKSETVTELVRIDTKPGEGPAVVAGQQIQVNYTGWLYDPSAPESRGQMFDTSAGRAPFALVLGGGMVIQGWDLGIVGMKEGGTRTLIIPPDLAYGARGAGRVIPPNATLVFDVELLKIVSPPPM